MAKRVGVDKWLFGVVLLLVLFGLVMVFSASAVMAKSQFGSASYFMVRQSIWAGFGLLAVIVVFALVKPSEAEGAPAHAAQAATAAPSAGVGA